MPSNTLLPNNSKADFCPSEHDRLPLHEINSNPLKYIARFILKQLGWKIVGEIPPGVKKFVIIEAPHTSYHDFYIGRLAFYMLGVKAKFLIKKEVFIWPFGRFIKALGGIPVNRGSSNNTVKEVAQIFARHEALAVTVTPEGTRKRVTKWKKGFYYIAERAGVPILLGYLDYGKKEGGIGPMIIPKGNFEEDFKQIEDFYRGIEAKYPEKFNLSK